MVSMSITDEEFGRLVPIIGLSRCVPAKTARSMQATDASSRPPASPADSIQGGLRRQGPAPDSPAGGPSAVDASQAGASAGRRLSSDLRVRRPSMLYRMAPLCTLASASTSEALHQPDARGAAQGSDKVVG